MNDTRQIYPLPVGLLPLLIDTWTNVGILASFYIWTHKLTGQAKFHHSVVPAEGGQAQHKQFDTHPDKVCMIQNY